MSALTIYVYIMTPEHLHHDMAIGVRRYLWQVRHDQDLCRGGPVQPVVDEL